MKWLFLQAAYIFIKQMQWSMQLADVLSKIIA